MSSAADSVGVAPSDALDTPDLYTSAITQLKCELVFLKLLEVSACAAKNLRLVVTNPNRTEPAPAKVAEVPKIVRLLALARHWQALLDRGEVRNGADIAKRAGMVPARVSNILCLLRLHPLILDHIEQLPAGTPERYVTERRLRPITRMSHEEQLGAVGARIGLRNKRAG